MTDTIGHYANQRFTVLKPDRFFPHDFEVIEETAMLIRIRNEVETYWLTRIRFEESLGTVFRKGGKHDQA